jgi:FAD dependent monooxygenase
MFSEYCCIFGVSVVDKAYRDFTPGISHVVYDNKVSLGAIIGINKKVFWFVFIKLDRKYYAPNIPRFSPADAEALAQEHKHRKLTEEVEFRHLWDTRVRCTVVALEEGVMRRWFNERTVLLGDSAHKVREMRK